jgi:hypothetical protein
VAFDELGKAFQVAEDLDVGVEVAHRFAMGLEEAAQEGCLDRSRQFDNGVNSGHVAQLVTAEADVRRPENLQLAVGRVDRGRIDDEHRERVTGMMGAERRSQDAGVRQIVRGNYGAEAHELSKAAPRRTASS